MKEVFCCPICMIKRQEHFGGELSFNMDHFTSTMDHYIHQIVHHPFIPNTIHLFRIKQFEAPLMHPERLSTDLNQINFYPVLSHPFLMDQAIIGGHCDQYGTKAYLIGPSFCKVLEVRTQRYSKV